MNLTLESIKAEQTKLADMIARLEAQAGRITEPWWLHLDKRITVITMQGKLPGSQPRRLK